MEIGGETVIYNAFFGGVEPAIIKRLLNLVVDGRPVYNKHLKREKSPDVVCVSRGDPEVRNQYDDCEKHPHAMAFFPSNAQSFIFLCNGFLAENIEPTSEDCSTFTGRRRTKLTPSTIQITQTSVLLHELLHIYSGPGRLEKEAYEINEVMALPLSKKYINVANYAYFVGSESSTLLSRRQTCTDIYWLSGVVAGCDEFPKKFHNPDQELRIVSHHILDCCRQCYLCDICWMI